METAKKPEEYSSVQKAIEILLAFTTSNQEIGTLELSEKLHLHKSTVSRLLHILSHYELLRQDKKSKKYVLGRSAHDLGLAAKRYIDSQLIVAAQARLIELRDLLGEHVSFEVISGNSSTVVCHAASTLPVHVSADIGERLPIHAVAGAKSILAFLPPEEVDVLIGDKLTSFTPNTITDPKAFKRHLKEIRKQGFAVDRGEYIPEVHAIGAPVFNSEGKPIGAVVLPSPAYRMESHLQSDTTALVKNTAAKISEGLFFLESEE
jgi:DNA-binding IclR family transcriptional regulator